MAAGDGTLAAMPTPYRRSTLALAVLSLLAEEPMHPYRMQRLIRERAKDAVVNVGQRASLYKTIERLHRDGLVRVRETSRDQAFPARTVYELTAEGREVWDDWLGEALSTPAREFPEFPAALSFIALLTPPRVADELERRLVRLRQELAAIDAGLAVPEIPRLFLLEDEYRRAVLAAEIAWLETVIADLRTGRLTWEQERLRELARTQGGGRP